MIGEEFRSVSAVRSSLLDLVCLITLAVSTPTLKPDETGSLAIIFIEGIARSTSAIVAR